MTSQLRRPFSLLGRAMVLGLVGGALLSGCASEEPDPVAVAPPTPPPKPTAPPPPAVTPVSQLMADLRIDGRIDLPEDKAPGTTEDRKAVLEFFDAFARGDETSLSGMMSLADKLELDAIVDSGVWKDTVDAIESIELMTGDSEFGPCVLAIFTTGFEFQPQLWYYQSEEGQDYTFQAAASPPGIIDRLSGDNWIQSWHDILQDEMALADEPEDDLSVPQVNLDDEESDSGGTPSAGGPNPGRGPAPGGKPGKRRRPPPKNPRRPPGPQPGR